MRFEDWDVRLFAELARHSAMPMRWGISDCAWLALDCARAISGADPWKDQHGAYSTEKGAAKMLRKLGFPDLGTGFATEFPEVAPAMARRGDIGTVLLDDGQVSGVVVLGPIVKARGAETVIDLPRARLIRTFAVR